MALRGLPTIVQTVIAGRGGRSITTASLIRMIGEARAGKLDEPHFLDLDRDVINRELDRQKQQRRSGPTAENVLRDSKVIAGKVKR
jgi:pyruvate ferredoxin oxidoreductase alpha subunit